MKKRKNNSGSYQNRDGRHIIQFLRDGKRHTKSFKTEENARAALKDLSKVKTDASTEEFPWNLNTRFLIWIVSRGHSATNYGYKVRYCKHWGPIIGHLRPEDIDVAILKGAIATFKKKGLGKSSVGLLFRILSSFMSEMLEDGVIAKNPVQLLSKKTRGDLISIKDPSKNPFIKKLEDVSRIYTWLNGQSKSVSIGFALGALAGLRLNEIRALSWPDIDFENRLIHVRWQAGTAKDGTDRLRAPKNKTGRSVPISDSLYTILESWFERTLGEGWLIRPHYTDDKNKKFIGRAALTDLLRRAVSILKIPKLSWYAATRHTFASQWVMAGGSLVKLKEIMGHASFSTTERSYLHLVPGQYSNEDRNVLKVELKNHEKPVDWKLLDIDSKVRGDILPSDHWFNVRDSRPNGE